MLKFCTAFGKKKKNEPDSFREPSLRVIWATPSSPHPKPFLTPPPSAMLTEILPAEVSTWLGWRNIWGAFNWDSQTAVQSH